MTSDGRQTQAQADEAQQAEASPLLMELARTNATTRRFVVPTPEGFKVIKTTGPADRSSAAGKRKPEH